MTVEDAALAIGHEAESGSDPPRRIREIRIEPCDVMSDEDEHDSRVARFGSEEAWGGMGTWNNNTREWRYVGGYIRGQIELDQAQTVPGAPVSGRFSTLVVEW